MRVGLVDYHTGNLGSLERSLSRLGVEVQRCSRAEELAEVQRLVLPGVGHFQTAMRNLQAQQLTEPLHHCAFERKIPILGICLGMQLMARHSQEAESPGLGWVEGSVRHFQLPPNSQSKVPHIGWNRLQARHFHPLLEGIEADQEFYFTHSYHFGELACLLAETTHGYAFPSVLAQDNLLGVQFHPEKSHQAGQRLLENFLAL